MNPISAFFVRNIIAVFFFYGLAFFSMGLALALASRRTSGFRFVQAIRPLAAFGILHGLHEWIEMFQKVFTLTRGYIPTLPHEMMRLLLLTVSFLMLLAFATTLLGSGNPARRLAYLPIAALAGVWLLGTVVVASALRLSLDETLPVADALSRYSLGVPAALLGTWALMAQQRTFREHDMPQFGRDLVWCAVALFLFGAIGQIFVRQTVLSPSTLINSTLFLQWFGIPVQLFRAIMAAILAFYMLRALNAFDLESRRLLEATNEAKLVTQEAALEAERQTSQKMERLNEELQLTTQELSLVLDLLNQLASPMSLRERLHNVLERIVHSLYFPNAGMILLAGRSAGTLQDWASVGFLNTDDGSDKDEHVILALDLGERCVVRGTAICRHLDGEIVEFLTEEVLENLTCRQYPSPVSMLALPLVTKQAVFGSIVLGRIPENEHDLSFDEFRLIGGIAQQLGISIENARLYQEAQAREKSLGELLHQAVGAQESERQRIARELHDAIGQSLTAIALGLRGVETSLDGNLSLALSQVQELKSFTTNALGELRRTIADLRPPQLDDLGLIPALQWYIQEFESRYPIHTDFIIEGERKRMLPEYETVLFRIAQEALTNIAKHANASHATVQLDIAPTKIHITITDDGCGFDSERVLQGDRPGSGWGLLGIQERTALLGGRYEIHSQPGRGTRIQVSVPLKGKAITSDEEDTIATG